jgi:DNA polymerase III subunit delta'
MWSRLVGQEQVVRALRDAITNGRTGHAYLFAGPEGVGRSLAAKALAASLNCPDGGCGACAVCAKVLRGTHSDVHWIAAEGQQILLTQIKGGPGERGIITEAFRSPVEGRMKVFIVDDAERMNPAAANALLKVLEEPPADVVFVLMTARPDDILETIASRCRRLDFASLPESAVRQVLTDHHGIDAATAHWAAHVGGNLARALRLAHDDDARRRYDAHRELALRLHREGIPEAVCAADEVRADAEAATKPLLERQKAEVAALAEQAGDSRSAAALKKRMEARHKRELRRAETDALQAALEDLASFYRDALVAQAVPDSSSPVAARPAALLVALERIETTRRSLERNAAPGLAIEALFAELADVALRPVGRSPAGAR